MMLLKMNSKPRAPSTVMWLMQNLIAAADVEYTYIKVF
jgi:hypothetical protein